MTAFLNGAVKDTEKIPVRFPPELRTYDDAGNEMLALLNKALYGCVQSELFWYKLFTTTLEGMGFEVNPYDMCVANAVINGKQCTI